MPRWSKQDDATVAAIAACRERPGAGSAWPAADLPDRGRLTGQQVKKRWLVIKHKFTTEAAAAAPVPAHGAGKQVRRRSPMRARAEAVGVQFQPSPAGQREIVANPDASSSAVARARRLIKRQKTAMHQTVARAEKSAAKKQKLLALREEIREKVAVHLKFNSTDCPGLGSDGEMISNYDRLRLWNAAAEVEEERSRIARQSVGSFLWLSMRKSEWREQRRARARARAHDRACQLREERQLAGPAPPAPTDIGLSGDEIANFTRKVMETVGALRRLNDHANAGIPVTGLSLEDYVRRGTEGPFVRSSFELQQLPYTWQKLQNERASRLSAARACETWEKAAFAEILANRNGERQPWRKYMDTLVANYESNKAQYGIEMRPWIPNDSLENLGADDYLVWRTDHP